LKAFRLLAVIDASGGEEEKGRLVGGVVRDNFLKHRMHTRLASIEGSGRSIGARRIIAYQLSRSSFLLKVALVEVERQKLRQPQTPDMQHWFHQEIFYLCGIYWVGADN